MPNINNNSLIDNSKKSPIREKRILQAKQEKLARLLKSGILSKLKNAQGFTFNR